MISLMSTPMEDGYRMPAEYEPHKGTIMIWPVRPGSWVNSGEYAKKVFAKIAAHIAKSEELFMLADKEHLDEARNILFEAIDEMCASNFDKNKSGKESTICEETDDVKNQIKSNIHVLEIDSDDSWARDVGPTYVVNDKTGDVRGVNWQFNAWGGTVDGLYQHWEKDDAVAISFLEKETQGYYDAVPFVLEGGSIHSDGEGTVLVTESCLLSGGRNPKLSRKEIETRLQTYLGAKKIIWLPRGIYNDETNEHVDNVCAYVGPAEVVLAWTECETDPQYELSKACLELLEKETDACGRAYTIHKMLIPENPVCVKQEELDGLVFDEEEDTREPGERLAASYVNFYIANGAVLVPQFDDVNDGKAVSLLQKLFPTREIVPIYARDIIVGGGNIHCITQQIPKGN